MCQSPNEAKMIYIYITQYRKQRQHILHTYDRVFIENLRILLSSEMKASHQYIQHIRHIRGFVGFEPSM